MTTTQQHEHRVMNRAFEKALTTFPTAFPTAQDIFNAGFKAGGEEQLKWNAIAVGGVEKLTVLEVQPDGDVLEDGIPLYEFPTVKAKQFIQEHLGGDFTSEDSIEVFALSAFIEFWLWYVAQTKVH